MKQKVLIGISILIICFMLLMTNQSLAITSDFSYKIESYDINMIVNEDNTFDITENITVDFKEAKHGIYRKIPLKNAITRTDGTTSNNVAKITDISVSENYTTSNENGYKVIKIGDENSTLTGEHTYTIKYKYNIGKDPLKNADELYFNLIGNQWDVEIDKVTFSITMPKAFDETLLGFSTGKIASTDSSNVIYNVNGNTITGNTINSLKGEQALTVRLTLPEGYFVGASTNIETYYVYVIILCIVFIIVAYILWAKYGKDEQVIETVQFYPPEGYNSAEVGFLYNGEADTKTIISLLIYLANKGYLKIEEKEEKVLFSKTKSFTITKLKEYDGTNEIEKMFFNGLFKNSEVGKVDINKAKEIVKEAKKQGEKVSFKDALEMSIEPYEEKDSVTASDLYDNFYKTLNRIKQKLNSKENKNKIFESLANGKIKYLVIMIIIIFLLITLRPLMEYGDSRTIMVAILFPRFLNYDNDNI